MERIEDYLPPEDMMVGETINVHHCKQGRQNDRLYITRKNDGHLWNCFHCGWCGFAPSARHAPTKSLRPGGRSGGAERGASRYYVPHDTGSWSGQAQEWLDRAGVTEDERLRYGLCLSDTGDRVYIPCLLDGSVVGAQERGLGGGPKYLSYPKAGKALAFDSGTHLESFLVVVVEDALSAIKVGRQYHCVALCGTHLHPQVFAYLTGKYDEFLVWLDMDNPEVIRKAGDAAKRLRLFGDCGIVRGVGRDPKLLTDDEIRETVERFRP